MMSSGSLFDGVEKDSKMDENDDLVSILSQETEKWYVMNICHGCVSVCYNLYVWMSFLLKVSRHMSCV